MKPEIKILNYFSIGYASAVLIQAILRGNFIAAGGMFILIIACILSLYFTGKSNEN